MQVGSLVPEEVFATLSQYAHAADNAAVWPSASWNVLRQAGVLRWCIPTAYSGAGLEGIDLLSGNERLAGACLTTCFILSQRDAACRRLRDGDPPGRDPVSVQLGWGGAVRRNRGFCDPARSRPFHPGPARAARTCRVRARARSGHARSCRGRARRDPVAAGARGRRSSGLTARDHLGGGSRPAGARLIPRSELARRPRAFSSRPFHCGARDAAMHRRP